METTPSQPRDELEQRCLSSLMKDRADVLAAISAGLSPSHFMSDANRRLFSEMIAAASAKSSGTLFNDLYLAFVKLGAGAPTSPAELVAIDNLEATCASAHNLRESVITFAKRDQLVGHLRQAIQAVTAHIAPIWSNVMEDADKHLSQINDLAHDSKAESLADMVDAYVEEQKNPLAAKRVPIGIPDWDRVAGSLREGELVTLAGRPGTGKTALAIQIANYVAQKRSGTVAFFSLEMTGKELVGRIALNSAGRSGVGDHSKEVAERIKQASALKGLKNLHIFEEKAARTLAAIEARCRLLAASKRGIDLVVIDYLQLISVPAEMKRAPREQQVADMSRRLKLLAVDIKCPIILLAQLNRESEKEQRQPRLSDLRESGAIEQDSDRVWFLFVEQKPDAPAPDLIADSIEIALYQAKCRGGKPGIISALLFDRPCFRFSKVTESTKAFDRPLL